MAVLRSPLLLSFICILPLQWHVQGKRQLRNLLNDYCLGFDGPAVFTKTLKVQFCSPWGTSDANRQFFEMDGHGRIVHTDSGFCIDVDGFPGISNFNDIRLYNCETPDLHITDQQWSWDGTLLKNRRSGRCMDVHGAPAWEVGSNVHLFDCESSTDTNSDQRWSWVTTGHQIRSMPSSSPGMLCLGLRRNGHQSIVEGQILRRVACQDLIGNSNDMDQLWQMRSDGQLVHGASGLCLGVMQGADGAGVQLRFCSAQRNLLEWEFKDHQLVHKSSGRRLDVAEDSDRAVVNTNDDRTATQRWIWQARGHLIKNLASSNMCLNLFGAGTAPGTKLNIWHCATFDDPVQRQFWSMNAAGQIRHVISGLCIDIPSFPSGPDDGLELQLHPCEMGANDHRWAWNPPQIKNQASSKCIDVFGLPGVEPGTKVQQLSCEDPTDNLSDQRWDWLAPVPHGSEGVACRLLPSTRVRGGWEMAASVSGAVLQTVSVSVGTERTDEWSLESGWENAVATSLTVGMEVEVNAGLPLIGGDSHATSFELSADVAHSFTSMQSVTEAVSQVTDKSFEAEFLAGVVWQWKGLILDNCGIITRAETRELSHSPDVASPPCCPPDMFEDPNNTRGKCVTDICICEPAQCQALAGTTEAATTATRTRTTTTTGTRPEEERACASAECISFCTWMHACHVVAFVMPFVAVYFAAW